MGVGHTTRLLANWTVGDGPFQRLEVEGNDVLRSEPALDKPLAEDRDPVECLLAVSGQVVGENRLILFRGPLVAICHCSELSRAHWAPFYQERAARALARRDNVQRHTRRRILIHDARASELRGWLPEPPSVLAWAWTSRDPGRFSPVLKEAAGAPAALGS